MDVPLERLLDDRHAQVMHQFEVLHDRLHAVNDKLDAQNGRVRALETEVAVLKAREFPAGKMMATLGTMAAAGLTYWASR